MKLKNQLHLVQLYIVFAVESNRTKEKDATKTDLMLLFKINLNR